MTHRIHQVVALPGTPEQIYESLLNAQSFSDMTGAPAEIDRHAGGAFSLFGGQILGRNVELVPSALIVQAWRVAGWQRGDYSIARFELSADVDGANLTFDQVGYPEEAHDDLDAGWHEMYWGPLRRHLEE